MLEAFLFLGTGFVFGLQHAFDADHIAALSVLNSQKTSRFALRSAVAWGLGHAAVLLLVCLALVYFQVQFLPEVSIWMEKMVAGMLVFLGARAFFRYVRSEQTVAAKQVLIHNHPPAGLHMHRSPSFWVGALHGLAGSAAILILLISTFQSALLGLFFIFLFSAGTILGMALFVWAFSFGMRILRVKQYEKYAGLAAGVFSFIIGIKLFFSEFI